VFNSKERNRCNKILSIILVLILILPLFNISLAGRNGYGNGTQNDNTDVSESVVIGSQGREIAQESKTRPEPSLVENAVIPVTEEEPESTIRGKRGRGIASNDSTVADSGKNGGSEGLIKISLTVEGLETEVLISLDKKVEEGEEPIIIEKMTNEHIAIFEVSAGGSCTVVGEDIPGYITPDPIFINLTGIKGKFSIDETLLYVASYIPVESIDIHEESAYLLKELTEKLEATIYPVNASNQLIIWTSSNEMVATVDETGVVTAQGIGEALITAASEELLGIYDTCQVIVDEVISINLLDPIEAMTGEIISLPAFVVVKNSTQEEFLIPVVWFDEDDLEMDPLVAFNTEDVYEMTGKIKGSPLTTPLIITVTGDTTGDVSEVILSPQSTSIYLDDTGVLTISSVEPVNTNLKSLIWESVDPSIVSIIEISEAGDFATIRGNTLGATIINVKNLEGTVVGSSYVMVSIDSTLTDEVYIIATNNEFEELDQFDYYENIYITAYNLPFLDYNIKIEEKSSTPLLGEGTFSITNENTIIGIDEVTNEVYTKTFIKLSAVLDYFNLSDTYSKSYFVSVSHEGNYPSGDYEEDGTPKTLVDNFKISSPIPTGNIDVDVNQLVDGEIVALESSFFDESGVFGPEVILGREIKESTALETEISDYYTEEYKALYLEEGFELDDYPDLVKYSDEVKLKGYVKADGSVFWYTPKETLKIGGYILLIELPEGYYSNLNLEYDEGALLKEVHILRDLPVYREITVLPIT
jgi:uncharacterized protein YjdB